MDKDEILTLSPQYTLHVLVKEEAVVLHAGTAYEVLEGRNYMTLFQCLTKGASTAAAIAHQLAAEMPEAETLQRIDELVADGVLVEHVPDLTEGEYAAAIQLGLPPRPVADALRATKVALVTYDLADVECLLQEAMRRYGLAVSRQAEGANFIVVAARHWRDERLHTFSRHALASKQPWMLVILGGPTPFIGPLFRPSHTANFADLYGCLQENDRLGRFLIQMGRSPVSPADGLNTPLVPIATQVAAWEAVKWVVQGENRNLEDQLLTFDVDTWQPMVHPVRSCSGHAGVGPFSAETAPPLPPVLRSRKKLNPARGYRTVTAETAYDCFKHLISPLTGLFRHERPLPAPPGGLIHTYLLEHDIVKEIDSLDALYLNEHAASSGKGITDQDARNGALWEGIERYCSRWSGREYIMEASFSELEQDGALHPHVLLGFSEQQYTERKAWNAAHPSPTLFVPEPFDPDQSIAWVPAWSLTHQTWRYVPAAFAYLGYTGRDSNFCIGDSNGNASGMVLEEAFLQGFLELVERDAVALWWYNQLRRPGIDLCSFTKHPYFNELRVYYDEVFRRDVHVLDLTSDLGLPTFVAVSRRHDRSVEDIIMGFGAHLDAASALYRALTEMNQGLHSVLTQHPDGTTRYLPDIDPDRLAWYQQATLASHPYLIPDSGQPLKTAADYLYTPTDDLLDDVHLCLDRAQACGLEVCMLELTRKHVGAPVVKVIVPGLLHWWRRLGLRRLYEVPVQMGWLEAPLDEAALNPFSITM